MRKVLMGKDCEDAKLKTVHSKPAQSVATSSVCFVRGVFTGHEDLWKSSLGWKHLKMKKRKIIRLQKSNYLLPLLCAHSS